MNRFKVPSDTKQFMKDVLKKHVIKIYYYLGKKWNSKEVEHLFTIKEIEDYIKVDTERVKNALLFLERLGFIKYESVIGTSYKRLISFSTKYPKKNKFK